MGETIPHIIDPMVEMVEEHIFSGVWQSFDPPPFFLQRLLDIQPAAEPVAEGAADAHAALRVPRGRDRAQRVRDRGVRGVPREQHELLDPGPRDLRLGTRDVAARGERALASDATVPVHRGVSDMLE